MARAKRRPGLSARGDRLALRPRRGPYWEDLAKGCAIGYRRSRRRETSGSWVVRKGTPAGYRQGVLGVADDYRDADGREVLSHGQALALALKWTPPAAAEAGQVVTVRDAVNAYMADFAARKRPRATVRTWAKFYAKVVPNPERRQDKRQAPKHPGESIVDLPLAKLTTARLRAWHHALVTPTDDPDRLRARQASANRHLAHLRAALNWAYRNGALIDTDKAWKIVVPFRDVDTVRVEFLTPDQTRRLLNSCDPDFRAIVGGALLTGARWQELASCKVGHYADGCLLLVDTKNGTPRRSPLNGAGRTFFDGLTAGRAAEESLFCRADGTAWQPSDQLRRMAAACVACGIKPLGFHQLRHTFAAALVSAGVAIKVVSELLGHKDSRITERHYAHLAPGQAARAVESYLPQWWDDDVRPKLLRLA